MEEVSLFGGEWKALQFLGLCIYLGGAPLWVYRSGCDKNAGRRKEEGCCLLFSFVQSKMDSKGSSSGSSSIVSGRFLSRDWQFYSKAVLTEEERELSSDEGLRVEGLGFRHQHHGRRSATAGTEYYCKCIPFHSL